MSTTAIATARRLLVTKPFSMTNRYEIRDTGPDGMPGTLLASAQQKPFALREQVTFFTDAERDVPVLTLRGRGIVLVNATYDVVDGGDVPLGTVRRQGAVLSPPVWQLDSLAVSALGQQVDGLTAFWRRNKRGGAAFFDLELLDPEHRVVLAVGRRTGVRDSYLVEVRDARVDGRLAVCVAVGLDLARRRNEASDGGASTTGAVAASG